jgi:hypothetical protein
MREAIVIDERSDLVDLFSWLNAVFCSTTFIKDIFFIDFDSS